MNPWQTCFTLSATKFFIHNRKIGTFVGTTVSEQKKIMAPRYKIVKVKDNRKTYFAIKEKEFFFSKWKFITERQSSFHMYSGWIFETLKFETLSDAEKYLMDELLPHNITEYLVKEYDYPS